MIGLMIAFDFSLSRLSEGMPAICFLPLSFSTISFSLSIPFDVPIACDFVTVAVALVAAAVTHVDQ